MEMRSPSEIDQFLLEGETLIEWHGTRLRMTSIRKDGKIYAMETSFDPKSGAEWHVIPSLVAFGFAHLHEKDFVCPPRLDGLV